MCSRPRYHRLSPLQGPAGNEKVVHLHIDFWRVAMVTPHLMQKLYLHGDRIPNNIMKNVLEKLESFWDEVDTSQLEQ